MTEYQRRIKKGTIRDEKKYQLKNKSRNYSIES